MSAQLALNIGDVVRLQCKNCNPPKPKYYIVLQVEPKFRTFLINTALTRFQASRPDHVAYNPIILAAEHAFLEYDSHIGGDHVSHEHDLAEVTRVLTRDPTCFLGHISDAAKHQIRAMLHRTNPHISGKHLRKLREVWGLDPKKPAV